MITNQIESYDYFTNPVFSTLLPVLFPPKNYDAFNLVENCTATSQNV